MLREALAIVVVAVVVLFFVVVDDDDDDDDFGVLLQIPVARTMVGAVTSACLVQQNHCIIPVLVLIVLTNALVSEHILKWSQRTQGRVLLWGKL